MTKAEAFHAQAGSDLEACLHLTVSALPDCHALHYLQMAAEKLVKAVILRYDPTYAERQHQPAKDLVQHLRNPDIGTLLGWSDDTVYRAFLARVELELAEIERLCPTVCPPPDNVEYPWEDSGTGQWLAPAQQTFGLASSLKAPWHAHDVLVFLSLLLARFNSLP